jgi:hypothetical protein
MQTHHSPTTSSYTFILTEDEWYSATEQQREAWVSQIQREGGEAKANNLNILVRPDAVMSVSPVAGLHSVYCHVIQRPDSREQHFRDGLMRLCEKYVGPGARISPYRARQIAAEIFG